MATTARTHKGNGECNNSNSEPRPFEPFFDRPAETVKEAKGRIAILSRDIRRIKMKLDFLPDRKDLDVWERGATFALYCLEETLAAERDNLILLGMKELVAVAVEEAVAHAMKRAIAEAN